jgi:chemotaxis protein MotB
MSRKRQRAADAGPPGAPEWVVTFTDMISLLVTFFVLLMTFSSLSEYDLLRVSAFLSGTRGILESSGHTLIKNPQDDYLAAIDIERGALKPHSRPAEELPENLAEMGQRLTEDRLEVRLEDVADGLVIEFGARASFSPGSAQVTPDLEQSLVELGDVLGVYPHMVVVEGFTDTAFKPTAAYPTADALAFARASNAARVLVASTGLDANQVQVAGLGQDHPRADESTAEGRQRNRRVEVRVISLSTTRAAHLEARHLEREGER